MNPKFHLLAAVAALSLGACSTDDTCTGPEPAPKPQKDGYKISFTVAEDPESRTTLDAGDNLRWVFTDQVGIYTVGQSANSNTNSNALTKADVNQSPVEFIGLLENYVSKGDMFYAYYPYDAAQSTDPAAVTLSIPAMQKQTVANVYNGESNPLVALPVEIDWEQNSYAGRISSVRFRQLGAIVELQLYSSDEALRSEKIRSVTFESDAPLAGDFPFNLTTVTVKEELPISGYESTKATTTLDEPATIPATKDEAARVYLTIAPGEYTGRIVVNTDVAQYTFPLAAAMTFERAVIKGLPADLAKAKQRDMYINFEDPEVKRICIENWDTNLDGELSYEEAAAVADLKEVFKWNENIASFNELRYFTGLQSIGTDFATCSSLTSINIPDGVTTIGESAFCNCYSLTSIDIPNGVTAIGGYAFVNCSSLTSINIPNGVTTFGDGVFSGCGNLTSIDIPDGVTEIGEHFFHGCSSLTSITIPEGVTTIGEDAFYCCSGLTSINIPQKVSSIGGAFGGCTSLSAFYGKYASPDNRCLIQDGVLFAFAPAGLTEYPIPDEVTKIGYSAFSGSYLTSINIPDRVTSIGASAFSGCQSLASINIPDKVTIIAGMTFMGCHRLKSINIPNGVTEIGWGAFESCLSLTSINIPDGVTRIGGSAFYYSGLTSINIPDKVTMIGRDAFSHCYNLTSITIPDGVTAIGQDAFCFCSSLTSVYCKPTTPPTLDEGGAFNGTLPSIYVPTASVDAYRTAEGWSNYASKIVAYYDGNGTGIIME